MIILETQNELVERMVAEGRASALFVHPALKAAMGAAIVLLVCLYSQAKIEAKRGNLVTCDMVTYAQAQADAALYHSDPRAYFKFRRLDADHDGEACEYNRPTR